MSANNILLGYGVLSIGDVDVGLCRGGGQFTVERTYRAIAADGDKGKVKDRIVIDSSIPRLKVSMLELISDNITKLYPGTSATAGNNNKTFTGTNEIVTADYNAAVKWTGKTKAGKSVVITVETAINLDNIDWALVDKDEVLAQVTFEGTYLDTDRETEPWNVVWATA